MGRISSKKYRVSRRNSRSRFDHSDTAARFKGAYCTVWEKEPLLELFGEMDVVAETLPEMAERVIAAEQ